MGFYMIGVIDYRAGNSPSVANALLKLGVENSLISTAEEFELCDGIILPGVGSADATISSLDELGLLGRLKEAVLGEKKPFLGICVGLQVLFEYSEEGETECMGFIKGKVRRFEGAKLRVPQMGWNKVDFRRDSVLTGGIREGYFYFVNSYYAEPEDESVILGTAEYGQDFCAFVESGNIFASQCHLEKSGNVGLALLKNFAGYAENTAKGRVGK
jgi:glutamine amidotransferase